MEKLPDQGIVLFFKLAQLTVIVYPIVCDFPQMPQLLTMRVVAVPPGEDPAEIATAEGGGARFREMVAGAVDLPEFQISLILDGVDSDSPRDRDRGLGEAAPVLAAVSPGATREDLTRRVAEGLGIDPTVVVARAEQAPPAGREPEPASPLLQEPSKPSATR